MCGIVGKISNKVIDEREIEKSLHLIHQRGPDAQGYWLSIDRTKYIGSTRLSIHDLSPSGKMPMHDHSNKVHIVMNGEVYNFKEIRKDLEKLGNNFLSDSDTEVVLKSYLTWGMECLDKFNGMYAIAILDERVQRLYLIRDRVGEKPLYCYHTNQIFAFASELKVFLEDSEIPNALNYEALSEYFQYGYIGSNHSIIKNVWQITPGTYLELDLNTLKYDNYTYWKLPEFIDSKPNQAKLDAINELEDLLTQSVRKQLLADVPVGVFLSGGVDSSLITALASKVSSQPLKTFHISMKDAPNLDEQKYADAIAHYFQTEHTVLSAEELTFDKFISIIGTIDEPMADSSYIPTYLVSELSKQYVTVALGGDGGDELFGGYHHYLHISEISKNQSAGRYRSLIKKLPIGLRGRNYILSQDIRNYENGYKNFYDNTHLSSIFQKESRELIQPYNKSFYLGNELLEAATRHDFKNYLPDDILVKVDRAAMANSLETRAPFLDRHLIEFAFGKVPSHLKVNQNIKKFLLKSLAQRVLPSDFPIERKQGFSIPLTQWLSGKWKNSALEIITNTPNNLVEKKEIYKLINREGKFFNNNNRIYAILLFLIWMDKYKIKA